MAAALDILARASGGTHTIARTDLPALEAAYLQSAACKPRTARNNVLALQSILRASRATIDSLSAEHVRTYLQPGTVSRSSTWRQAQCVLRQACPDHPALGTKGPRITRQDQRYQRPDQAVITATEATLPSWPHSEQVAAMLALYAGLRKGEIGQARFENFDGKALRIDSKASKTGRARLIPLAPENPLRRHFKGRNEGFVIPGTMTERTDTVFRRVNARLRKLGWGGTKAIHALRKEFGARVATRHGIYAASELLGHSDIGTTYAHYTALVGSPEV